MKIRKIVTHLKPDQLLSRIETGSLKIDDDWPGLFIRGDDCIFLSMIIEDVLENKPFVIGGKEFLTALQQEILDNVLIKGVKKE